MQHDVDHRLVCARQVSSSDSRARFFRKREQTGVEPFDDGFRWRGDRDKTELGLAAHRRDVAQSARECFPSDVLRFIRGTKMNALDRHVGGDEKIRLGAALADNRTVITDTGNEFARIDGHAALQPLNHIDLSH